jgi:hypothetical protein
MGVPMFPNQQAIHDRTHQNIAGPDQKMDMIGHQDKGIAGGSGLRQNGTRSVQKIIPVLLFLKTAKVLSPGR